MNMGAWQHIEPRVFTASRHYNGGPGVRPRYVGRRPMASTAEGTLYSHNKAQEELIAKVFA